MESAGLRYSTAAAAAQLQNNWTDVTIPSPAGFPWVSQQPLPTAAATSLLGLLWTAGDPGSSSSSNAFSSAGRLSSAVKHRLECFGLHQVRLALSAACTRIVCRQQCCLRCPVLLGPGYQACV